MNNKCNNCAKFLTCNRKECKKITFVEAEILDKPKLKEKNTYSYFEEAGMTMKEAIDNMLKACERISETFKTN